MVILSSPSVAAKNLSLTSLRTSAVQNQLQTIYSSHYIYTLQLPKAYFIFWEDNTLLKAIKDRVLLKKKNLLKPLTWKSGPTLPIR